MPIDLFVIDKDFRDDLLRKMPELEKYYWEDDSDSDQTVFGFVGVPKESYPRLREILIRNKHCCEYEVREHETGKLVEVNLLNEDCIMGQIFESYHNN